MLGKDAYLTPLPTELPSDTTEKSLDPETHLFISGAGDCFLANDTIDSWVIDNIISMAPNITLDGVIFDHRCNLNTTQLIEAMKKLKQAQLNVSYRFVPSDIYTHNDKIKIIIESGYCDRCILDYSDTEIWTKETIDEQIISALWHCSGNSTGIKKNIILALEPPVQSHWKQYYLLRGAQKFQLIGIFLWYHENITSALGYNGQPLLASIYDHYVNATQKRQEGKLTLALQQKINQAIPKMEKFSVSSALNILIIVTITKQ